MSRSQIVQDALLIVDYLLGGEGFGSLLGASVEAPPDPLFASVAGLLVDALELSWSALAAFLYESLR